MVEGRHQAIVTHEEYRQANAMIRKVRPSVKHYTNKKDRVYYCGHCGRRLQKTFGVDQYYSCATALYQRTLSAHPSIGVRRIWSRLCLRPSLLSFS